MVRVDLSLPIARAACAVLAVACCVVACGGNEPPTPNAVPAAQPTSSDAVADDARAAAAPSDRVTEASSSPVAFDVGEIKTAAEYRDDPDLAGANLERGRLLSLACAACHTFGAGERPIIGPNLHGVFGRRAASVPDFGYSPALRASGLYWTPRSLAAWLADPAGFVSGTTMTFTGYHSADDRRDLVAYLLRATDN